MAVSKTVPASRLAAAVAAGLTVLGENRVQEAEAKAPLLPGATWHLIGPLQSNKARRAVELFDVIESVDSVELARRLDRLAGELGRAPLHVYLQVNVDRDEAKAGFLPESSRGGAGRAGRAAEPAPAGPDDGGAAGRLGGGGKADVSAVARAVRAAARRRSPGSAPGLSMGMTDDYPVAVEEGATVIRVGRALFGARPVG